MSTKTKVITQVCPRCECFMYPPRVALSRLDNTTSVCPTCGTDEAIEQWQNGEVFDWKKAHESH